MSQVDFYTREGLHTEVYDALTATLAGGITAGEVDFLVEKLAEAGGGPALELACGTGRVSSALAARGIDVSGLERSEAMLSRARQRQVSATWVRGDMRDFALEGRFGLIAILFRSFQSLLNREDQLSTLRLCRRHLRPGGRLVIDLFDPQLDRCLPGADSEPAELARFAHPLKEGHQVQIDRLGKTNDVVKQKFAEVWRFVERGPDGAVLREERETLEMRWIYRYEMQGLLELAGLKVVAEYSDYFGAPASYGGEQIWVATVA